MPITREYQCFECDDQPRIEQAERGESNPPFCPVCGNRMVWAPRSMSFGLKGSGWPSKEMKKR
jgi:DNA-directed RNA polymerase subunit RPC12/RpoP